MKFDNFKIVEIKDSEYKEYLENTLTLNEQYAEINFERDRSSFAGIGFKILNENKIIFSEEFKDEKVIKQVNKYESLFIGMENDYLQEIVDFYNKNVKGYGIEVLFLIYSDVKSSPKVFEFLMQELNKNINNI
jgi:hypothetical protein